jgi:hypothetical protein
MKNRVVSPLIALFVIVSTAAADAPPARTPSPAERAIGVAEAEIAANPRNYESYAANLKTVVNNYLFKGASKEAVQGLELKLWARGGLIYGKRCGHSLSLSNSQRKRAKVN